MSSWLSNIRNVYAMNKMNNRKRQPLNGKIIAFLCAFLLIFLVGVQKAGSDEFSSPSRCATSGNNSDLNEKTAAPPSESKPEEPPPRVDPEVEPPVPEKDTDGDGVPDSEDGCPFDSKKVSPGECGCGTPDTDSDGDGTPDCKDNCPDDPEKTEPGECGCGVPETDANGNGISNCKEDCPVYDPTNPACEPNQQGEEKPPVDPNIGDDFQGQRPSAKPPDDSGAIGGGEPQPQPDDYVKKPPPPEPSPPVDPGQCPSGYHWKPGVGCDKDGAPPAPGTPPAKPPAVTPSKPPVVIPPPKPPSKRQCPPGSHWKPGVGCHKS